MDTTPPAVPEPTPPTPQPSPDEKQWKVILHLSALAGIILPSCGNIIGPLVVWLIKKPEIPALDAEGRKVLNFQISAAIYIFVSSLIGFLTCFLAFLPIIVVIWWLIYTIIGAVKTSNNESFEFPLTIKML
jgi:uncharacterized Tic20 family protein